MPRGFDRMDVQSWSHCSARARPHEFASHPSRAAMLSSSNSTVGSFEQVDDASTVRPGVGAAGDGTESDASDAGNGGAANVAATGAASFGAGLVASFDGRVVGFASVYVQRTDGSMYIAPLLVPPTDGPYGCGGSRPIHPGTCAQARQERYRATPQRLLPMRRQPRCRYGD